MGDLILHNAEPELVDSLKKRADALGVTLEEAHREALQRGLAADNGSEGQANVPEENNPYAGLDFKEMLLAMPDVGEDEDFERRRDLPREVSLE